MNFGKLLATGKSFLGGRGVVAYREDKRVYLPKFNAEKNPFGSKPVEDNSAAAPAPKKVLTASAAPVAAKTQKIPVFSAPKPVRATSWTEKLNPFRAPEPVASPMQNAVQVELSLDAVKVLHNDLSDADVEVVPVKSRPASSVAAPRVLAVREPLDFLGERQLEAV